MKTEPFFFFELVRGHLGARPSDSYNRIGGVHPGAK